MTASRVCAALLLAAAATASEAADWRYSVGIHDFAVPDVDSDTYGVNVGASVDDHTESGRHIFGSLVMHLDHDQDHLDPDHIPIWWEAHAGTDGQFWQGASTRLGWTADVDTRANTASAVEREIIAMPALVGGYDASWLHASARAGAGWFFLEIDDDVPKTRGYDRDDFRNSRFAYSLAGDLAIKLGAWTASGKAQEWRDDHEWLQTQYGVSLRMAAGHSQTHSSEFVLSADFTEYNLDVYARPDVALPILPWDHDVLIRLSFATAW